MHSKNIEHSTSASAIQPLPRLGTATSQLVEKEYKSGASYVGQVQGNKRVGRGVFTWPNGAKYEGEFMENLRHGKGMMRFTMRLASNTIFRIAIDCVSGVPYLSWYLISINHLF